MAAKRLFLFAGYDAKGLVDDALVYYVRALSKLGDVIVCMDSDCDDAELQKLSPYVLHAAARRHGEYDFGSYKRAYMYAREARILQRYAMVYMVNDSVYGPLYDLKPILEDLESKNLAAVGLVKNPNRDHPHIQSWFIGMRPAVFTSEWFDEFISGVKKLPSKGQITREYEHGFSKRLTERNLPWACLLTVQNRGVYNKIRKLYRAGLPFMKKVAFTRHNGAYGRQIEYVLRRVSPDARVAILSSARHTWGNEYIDWLLTKNPVTVLYRGIQNGLRKMRSGKL